MNLLFDENIATSYRSRSQQARVMTEDWVARNLYCIRCGHPSLAHFPNNQPVADFYCPHCHDQIELKSHAGKYGRFIADGAYNTMMERLHSKTNPDLLVMEYRVDKYMVENLWLIPNYFFTPDIIEKRKPLSVKARRAGWIGCNILWESIPRLGKIVLVKESIPIPSRFPQKQFAQTASMERKSLASRGWLMDMLRCIEAIPSEHFTLADIYDFADHLQTKHPSNHHIKDKMRQQLQFLRDQGFLAFEGRGRYRKLTLWIN
ncbi:DpnI domain-containing protein [uncultured Selenomonas sp.]|uniref:DpnI domain-containing protein n=1 Tax=uncultured Selenomonas sp. TaxID=159275 RepID=UPI0025D8DF49|nr:DpnI domain-containing protein [uncultured Selenomonas sp.]